MPFWGRGMQSRSEHSLPTWSIIKSESVVDTLHVFALLLWMLSRTNASLNRCIVDALSSAIVVAFLLPSLSLCLFPSFLGLDDERIPWSSLFGDNFDIHIGLILRQVAQCPSTNTLYHHWVPTLLALLVNEVNFEVPVYSWILGTNNLGGGMHSRSYTIWGLSLSFNFYVSYFLTTQFPERWGSGHWYTTTTLGYTIVSIRDTQTLDMGLLHYQIGSGVSSCWLQALSREVKMGIIKVDTILSIILLIQTMRDTPRVRIIDRMNCPVITLWSMNVAKIRQVQK